jgi:hypothetical protein
MYPIRSHPAKLFGHSNCTWNTLSRCIVKVSTDSHWSYPRACEQLVLFVCGDNIISLRCLACRGDGSQLPNLRLLLDHLPPQPLHQHLVRQRRPRVHLLCPVPRHIHMSVTRWGVTPRNASLGPCATVPWIFFGKRYGDVIPTSIGPLRRGGTRDHRGGTGDLPSLLAPSKTNRLIDFYDAILMMGVTMLLARDERPIAAAHAPRSSHERAVRPYGPGLPQPPSLLMLALVGLLAGAVSPSGVEVVHYLGDPQIGFGRSGYPRARAHCTTHRTPALYDAEVDTARGVCLIIMAYVCV